MTRFRTWNLKGVPSSADTGFMDTSTTATYSLDEMLKIAMQKGASDVHLKAGTIPIMRKHGHLRPLSSKFLPISGEALEKIAFSLMDEGQKEQFIRDKDLDIAYGISGLGRFRINVLKQRGSIRMVIRAIPDKVTSIQDLNLPPIVEKIANLERGLILLTGATGSGKTSTLAAVIDHINRTKSKHIIMIEDPTEFLIRDRRSIITQRELGMDTNSFSKSLRAALRQDPDVILIGEMRDRETIEIALLAAETGHLVLSSLHTLDAQETVNRILAAFEPHQQLQVRMQLANVLKAVVSQRLGRKKDKTGFIPVVEILLNNPRIQELIGDPARTKEIQNVIEESASWGMQTFDKHLLELVAKNIIDYEEALSLSSNPENFAIRYQGVGRGEATQAWENTDFRHRVQKNWQNLTELELEELTQFDKRREKKKKNG